MSTKEENMSTNGENQIMRVSQNFKNSAEPNTFPTIEGAVDASRKLKRGARHRIVIEDGEYFLEKPIRLDAGDNGLTIESAPNAKVTLYGGRRITGWKPDGEHFWAADLPEIEQGQGKWNFHMLIADGQWCPRARLPEQGCFTNIPLTTEAPLTDAGTPMVSYSDYTKMKYSEGDISAAFDIDNMEVGVFHSWNDSLVGVSRIDERDRMIFFSNPCIYPPGSFCVTKYVIWNLREGMKETGQWYLDRKRGKVVYWPLAGEDMSTVRIIAPVLDDIISLSGTEESPVQDITVKGITLSATTTSRTRESIHLGHDFDLNTDGEYYGDILEIGTIACSGAAIGLQNAERCCLFDLRFVNVGGNAIKARKAVDSSIVDCLMQNVGAHGISASHLNNSQVVNNRITGVGRIRPGAAGIDIRRSADTTFAYNEITDVPHYGFALQVCSDCTIRHNRVVRPLQTLKHDAAGIYVGSGRRTVIRDNTVTDIEQDPGSFDGGWFRPCIAAYYLDAGETGSLIEGNIALRCHSALHINYGDDNRVVNNMFISDSFNAVSFGGSVNCVCERNVIQAENDIALYNLGRQNFYNNIVFTRKGKFSFIEETVGGGRVTPKTVKRELPPLNSNVDPKIGEPSEGLYYIAPELMERIGIGPIDVRNAGCRKDVMQLNLAFEFLGRYFVENLYQQIRDGRRRELEAGK